jgi:opacity protein-like surface antigen
MRRIVPVWCYIFYLVSSLALGQVGQPSREKWEFSVFFGSSHRGDNTYVTPVDSAVRNVVLGFAPGYQVGARLTENLKQHFGAELEYSLANQPMVFKDLRPNLSELNLSLRVHSVVYDVLFYGVGRKARLRPYGVFGGGVSLFEPFGRAKDDAVAKGVPLKNRWKAGVTVGGGVKYKVKENLGFRVDVRSYTTPVPDFGISDKVVGAPAQAVVFRPDGALHNMQFNVGFFYCFGF